MYHTRRSKQTIRDSILFEQCSSSLLLHLPHFTLPRKNPVLQAPCWRVTTLFTFPSFPVWGSPHNLCFVQSSSSSPSIADSGCFLPQVIAAGGTGGADTKPLCLGFHFRWCLSPPDYLHVERSTLQMMFLHFEGCSAEGAWCSSERNTANLTRACSKVKTAAKMLPHRKVKLTSLSQLYSSKIVEFLAKLK